MTAEKTYRPMNGWFPLFVTLVMIIGGTWLTIFKAIALGNF